MKEFTKKQLDRIIEMAWEDRTSFEAIKIQFDINQDEVIKIMRSSLKSKSFKIWRERTKGRKTKHRKINDISPMRFRSKNQK
ncbi:TIGR03643 family protein [Candidatus Marinimicrobia bacterium]|nr:TIGR03643 family protein [Candidatus Neomarinimicrobiota bacterium]